MTARIRPLRSAPALFATALAACLLSCNVTDKNLGNAPLGPGVAQNGIDTSAAGFVSDSISGPMHIYASSHVIKAGNKAQDTVTVQISDAFHNPVAGVRVQFLASLGSITASDTTDADGRATAVFTSAPRDGQARIIAWATLATAGGNSLYKVGTTIELAGLTVAIHPSTPDTSVGDTVPLAIFVTDADGQPMAGVRVKVQGARDSAGTTGSSGSFATSATRSSEGQVRIAASALGAADSVTLDFWTTPPTTRNRNLVIFADPASLPAANGVTSTIRVILYDDRHNPVAGKVIAFSASTGIITPTDTTKSDGSAQAVFTGLPQDVDALVTATLLSDVSQRAVATVTLAGLTVEIHAGASEALLGDTVPLSIRVRDAAGRALPDVQVALSGAQQNSVITNASGAASATVVSAQEQAVTVTAAALGGSDSAKIVFLQTLPTSDNSGKAGVGNLRIFAEHSNLRASNTDQTVVKVVAFDKFNNPLAGRPVHFTADVGIISAVDTTDANGEARATYRAVPVNTNARITASMTVDDSALAVATTVTLTGLQIEVDPQLTDALLNRQVPVTIRIIDGAGNPVPDAGLIFNGTPGVGTTNGKGEFLTAVTSGSEKRMTIVARALGAADSGSVNFWKVLPTTGPGDVTTIRNMRIFSSRTQLKADNSDFGVITVILTNENNNPAVGDVVHFTSDLGIIDQSATVDSTGRASVILHSAPVNGLCHVQATADGRNLSASTEVLFNGVTLQIIPDRTDLKVGELATLTAFLKDASGNPIGGDNVSFTLSGPGAFDNGNTAFSTVLNPNGQALVRVSGSSSGSVSVAASALNTTDSVSLNYSNNSLTLAVDKPILAVGGSDSALITATYVDGSNHPVPGAAISFAANAGKITNASVTTDGSGKASTYLKSAVFAGTATVQANASGGVAQIKVSFAAALPAAIKLSISPDNISINGGLASLKAVVTDAQGNMVSDQNVNFRILKGPGGGENVVKPVVATQNGEATSQLASGSLASPYRGVLVVATVGNISDTSKLTISGPPQTVTVSRPEDDSVTVAKGGIIDESTFEYFVGAVVQDINGNSVADGTEVHFSAVVTGMKVVRRLSAGWSGIGDSSSNVQPLYKFGVLDLPFEDINNNFKYDPGIDLNLDFNNSVASRGEDVNGDGVFDWNPVQYDTWFDFNGNGKCDVDVGEDSIVIKGKVLYHDLNQDGILNHSELIYDANGNGQCDLPPSGDYPYDTWDDRHFLSPLRFTTNDFAVTIDVSAVTKNGVANARLIYPRQLARRLFVTVNAEANGVRDRDGERFPLPQIKE